MLLWKRQHDYRDGADLLVIPTQPVAVRYIRATSVTMMLGTTNSISQSINSSDVVSDRNAIRGRWIKSITRYNSLE